MPPPKAFDAHSKHKDVINRQLALYASTFAASGDSLLMLDSAQARSMRACLAHGVQPAQIVLVERHDQTFGALQRAARERGVTRIFFGDAFDVLRLFEQSRHRFIAIYLDLMTPDVSSVDAAVLSRVLANRVLITLTARCPTRGDTVDKRVARLQRRLRLHFALRDVYRYVGKRAAMVTLTFDRHCAAVRRPLNAPARICPEAVRARTYRQSKPYRACWAAKQSFSADATRAQSLSTSARLQRAVCDIKAQF